MNCCNEYGQCTQSPDCPAGSIAPTRCETLGVCNAGPGCTCPPAKVAPVKTTRPHWMDGGSLPSSEVGNIVLIPTNKANVAPLGWLGTSLLLFWLCSVVGMVWLLMLGAGWAYRQWANLLWAFLSRLS